jgi:hypothetical protein
VGGGVYKGVGKWFAKRRTKASTLLFYEVLDEQTPHAASQLIRDKGGVADLEASADTLPCLSKIHDFLNLSAVE